jgi:hypothetical protein
MLSIIFYSLIFIGICLLFVGIVFKVLKIQQSATRKNNISSILDSLVSSRIIRPSLDFITRNKESFPNKLSLRLIEFSESAINLQKLYFIKLGCTVICTVLIIVIGYTNAAYEMKLIVSSQPNLYNDSNEKIAEYLNTSDNQLIENNASWFIEKLHQVQDIKIFKFNHFWVLLVSFFLPEMFLLLRWLLRGCVYKKEIIKLEYIFELLARIDGIKTIDIIDQMEKASKIYSATLCEFIRIFKYDKRKGFHYLRNKNIKSLAKLAETLEIYSLSDKEIALQILEREVMERDEAMIITADETLDFIDLAAFLSIVPMVYELVMLMLRPMLDVVYKAFEFI